MLEDISEQLEVHLQSNRFDTLNGLIFGTLGRVPADGDKFTLEIQKLSIQVVKVKNHMIETALVRKKVRV